MCEGRFEVLGGGLRDERVLGTQVDGVPDELPADTDFEGKFRFGVEKVDVEVEKSN